MHIYISMYIYIYVYTTHYIHTYMYLICKPSHEGRNNSLEILFSTCCTQI